MTAQQFSASARIAAPASVLYAILADYQHGHPQILPRPPFVSLVVEHGGTGAGSVVRVQMRVLGQVQTFRAVISEPEPGRVLTETNDTGYVTTFTVEPQADGREAQVTITTAMPARPGIGAALERWMVPRLLRPAYVRELANLAALAATRT